MIILHKMKLRIQISSHYLKRMFNKALVVTWFIFFSTFSHAQIDETAVSPWKFSGYMEPYYSFDFDKPDNHTKPGFIYAYNRHNEVNLHLGFVKAGYNTNKVRANLALMTGTYANANLAAEPGVLKNIFEANGGIKISANKSLWVDAGIFGSHIGFESAIGKDCWNLTRSILADNSPYYESGVKVSYTSDDGEWFLSGLILNGWQRIQRVDGNQTPAFGHQLTYKPRSKITLNSSSFVGSDTPDDVRLMRYFHNFYGIFQVTDKLGFTVGFDYGAQQVAKGSSDLNDWYSPVFIARISPNEKFNIAARLEYYSDENEVIISTSTPNGFKSFGYSLNMDFVILPNGMLRIEGRGFQSEDNIFAGDVTHYQLTSSLAISF